jgi:hypothetical protein
MKRVFKYNLLVLTSNGATTLREKKDEVIRHDSSYGRRGMCSISQAISAVDT